MCHGLRYFFALKIIANVDLNSQVSVTYDENPTAESTWKVITSIEGGCPARDTAGNLGDDTSATAPDPYTYNFTVPDDIPSGKAVLAWTWFNKVGNREMYMNCALVDLTGTSGSKSSYDALPDMFTANIGNGCSTADNKDVSFPDAGLVVQSLGSGDDYAAPVGSCGSSVSVSASASVSVGVTAATTTASTTETTAAGGIFASVAVSVGDSVPTATTTAAAVATTASTSSSSSSPSSSGSETAGSVCSDEGSNVCAGSTSYLVCASGFWTSMPIAAGTACSGSGANFAIVVARGEEFKKTRALRWVQRNLPFLG